MAGALTSLADEDHVTAELGDDGSCSPSSVTIVDLDATIDDDRRLGDVELDEAGSRPTTLRVPTPSSWEKYRVVVPTAASSSSHVQPSADLEEPNTDVKVVVLADHRNDLLKDDVDRRLVKKPCSCGAVSTDTQVFHRSRLIQV